MNEMQTEARSINPLYLYAIVPLGRDGAAPALDGIADGVGTIGDGRYAAVVGRAASAGLKGRGREELGRLLVAHQKVIEQIMRASPLLPVRFGTEVADERGVRQVLARGASLFDAAFAELQGCTQLEILVTWDLDAVFTGLAAEEPIATLKAELATASIADREAFGRRVKDALDARRATLAARVTEALGGAAVESIVCPVTDDRVVAHVTLLINADAADAVDRCLEALDADTGGQLRFRCIGPMPPSSFATLQVDCLDADAIERAGRVLQIETEADVDDVRAVYHRLARRAHPDAGQDQGSSAMAELTEAYKVLSRYAQARRAGGTGDMSDPSTAVMVSLRRQESAGAAEATSSG